MRKHGEQYPSDHRRWFRVTEDILDDPKLDDELPADVFRAFIRILATLNRTKSRDGRLALSRRVASLVAGRERFGAALARLRLGADAGLYTLQCEDGKTVIEVSKWPKHQGFAPTDPQPEPAETPAPTPTPKTTPTTKRECGSQSAPSDGLRRGSNSKSARANERVLAAWPAIRSAFAEHGCELSEKPGADRIALISKRLDEGRSEAELVAAVHGYVFLHGGLEPDQRGYNPRQYFRVQTIFKAEGFSDRVDLGMDPRDAIPPRRSGAQRPTPIAARGIGHWKHG